MIRVEEPLTFMRADLRAQALDLNALTAVFYDRVSASFSATRSRPWQGWERLWELVGDELQAHDPVRVLDVGCGNLRFARFLADRVPGTVEAYGIDACEPLLAEGMRACEAMRTARLQVRAVRRDVAKSLLDGEDFRRDAPSCSLAVAFGFMHHLPTAEQRWALLDRMVDAVVPGGLVAASFWRFADDERLRAKAEEATVRAQDRGAVGALGPGDYVLGWQEDQGALRYCHHLTEEEMDELSVHVAGTAEEIARFSADGKSGVLNRYGLWRRHDRS